MGRSGDGTVDPSTWSGRKTYSTKTLGASLPDELSDSLLARSKFPDAFHTDDPYLGNETIDGKVVEIQSMPFNFGAVSFLIVETSKYRNSIICPLNLESVVLDGKRVNYSCKGGDSYYPSPENQAYTNLKVEYILRVASGKHKGKILTWMTEHHVFGRSKD
jgi:hypothetical protein